MEECFSVFSKTLIYLETKQKSESFESFVCHKFWFTQEQNKWVILRRKAAS